MFDVFGQMWGTMLLNGLSTISLLGGLLAVCAAEKVAIALVSSVNPYIIIIMIQLYAYHSTGVAMAYTAA